MVGIEFHDRAEPGYFDSLAIELISTIQENINHSIPVMDWGVDFSVLARLRNQLDSIMEDLPRVEINFER